MYNVQHVVVQLRNTSPTNVLIWLQVFRDDAAAHLGVDVEVAVALEVPPLALCIVEQEAVFDDEESLYRGRQRKQQWVNPAGLKGTDVCRWSQHRTDWFDDVWLLSTGVLDFIYNFITFHKWQPLSSFCGADVSYIYLSWFYFENLVYKYKMAACIIKKIFTLNCHLHILLLCILRELWN